MSRAPALGAPINLNTWTYGGAGAGSNLVPRKDAINTMMTNLGGGYQLTEVDLSSFPTYP